jgi:hypothetical protein
MSGEDEVGFSRPPKRTRWKKGQSGNRGRRKPRRAPTSAEIIDRLLLTQIDMTENGQARRVTTVEAIALQLWRKALDGDPRAPSVLLRYQELAEQRPERAIEITFGNGPPNRGEGRDRPSEADDDGQV